MNDMYTIKQPNQIIFGYNSVKDYSFSDDSLINTLSVKKRVIASLEA